MIVTSLYLNKVNFLPAFFALFEFRSSSLSNSIKFLNDLTVGTLLLTLFLGVLLILSFFIAKYIEDNL